MPARNPLSKAWWLSVIAMCFAACNSSCSPRTKGNNVATEHAQSDNDAKDDHSMDIADRFDRLATAWEAHCEQHALDSHLNAFIDCDEFRQVVKLGRPAVRLVIERYAAADESQDRIRSLAPWVFAVEDITGQRFVEDRSNFSPSEADEKCLRWWEETGKKEYP